MKIYTAQEYEAIERNKPTIDTTAFDTACTSFRNICEQIKDLLGVLLFKGGFDLMQVFQASLQSKTTLGLRLAIEWSAANEYCKYEGNKIGYGQPEWWYKCWENKE